MRVLTSTLYCLLALFGCNDKNSITTVNRDQGALLSLTTQDRDTATFQCLRSSSGQCHYQVFEETCASEPDNDKTKCTRIILNSFSLAVGHSHLIKGLSGQVHQCTQAEAPTPGTRCSG